MAPMPVQKKGAVVDNAEAFRLRNPRRLATHDSPPPPAIFRFSDLS
jgi:hypothetical protein